MRLVFFGTPHFAATILDYLLAQKAPIVAVVTKPDKRRGRDLKVAPCAVKLLAEKHQLPLYQPLKARDPAFVAILKELKADIFVVAAYSEIFNAELLSLPPKGCVNVHASILPKYRGAAPIERCIMAGEKESGVTIMEMAKELDAGDIYAIAKTPLSPTTTSGELYKTLAKLGGEALWKVLQKIDRNEAVKTPQDHSQATFAPKIHLEDGEVDWRDSASKIYHQILGVTPKPGAWVWVEVNNSLKRLLLKKTSLELAHQGEPGEILPLKGLVIGCGKGALRLEEVQLEGKNRLSVEAFLAGIPVKNLTFKLKK